MLLNAEEDHCAALKQEHNMIHTYLTFPRPQETPPKSPQQVCVCVPPTSNLHKKANKAANSISDDLKTATLHTCCAGARKIHNIITAKHVYLQGDTEERPVECVDVSVCTCVGGCVVADGASMVHNNSETPRHSWGTRASRLGTSGSPLSLQMLRFCRRWGSLHLSSRVSTSMSEARFSSADKRRIASFELGLRTQKFYVPVLQ